MSGFYKMEIPSSGATESKHYNMKQFINAVREYSINKTEETANLINRHLQILSVTIDLSLFDPHTSVASEFFVSLHELLTCLEPRSPLAWCCVSALSTCCRNSSAREALIHTYQFIPPLSRLLGDHLSMEKKIRLLMLMQELTCGIKISWQIPHLSHLMSTLSRWVTSGSEDIVTLSLGVLVNLCYKNLPAIYTLSRCVDVKKFMRTAATLEGIKIEVHVCKLLIIFDHHYGRVPQEALLKLTAVTFKSICEAFKVKDSIQLRHIVEFFLDIKVHNGQDNFLLQFDTYDVEVDKLLKTVENNIFSSGDSTCSDPECVKLILQFLHSLVDQKLPKMGQFHERIVTLALQWLQNETVSSQALSVLRSVTVNLDTIKDPKILEPLLPQLPLVLVDLDMNREETPRNAEYNKKLSSLMELLASLIHVDSLRVKVMSALKEDHLRKVFLPLLGDPVTSKTHSNFDTPEMATLYANALFLVTEMSQFDEEWCRIQKELFQYKQIHILIAQTLYSSPEPIRLQMLQLSSLPMFPRKEVTKAMITLQPITHIEERLNNTSQQLMENFCFVNMSVAQTEKLDEMLNKLRESFIQNSLSNLATSEVMELYEYKLASMGHAERAAMASVEAASQRCTHLEHRIAQLTAELSRTRQLLFHAQQSQEDVTKDRNSLVEQNKELSTRLEAEKGRKRALTCQNEIKEKALQEKEVLLEETTKRLKESEGQCSSLNEQVNEYKSICTTFKENLLKKEKAYQKKEEMLSKANLTIDHLKSHGVKLEQHLYDKEAELAKCTLELQEVSKDLMNKKQILESITKLTRA